MAFHVRDAVTDAAVRRLAALKGKSLTATIREAVEHEYAREQQKISPAIGLRRLQQESAALRKPGGLAADKAFYDALSGDL